MHVIIYLHRILPPIVTRSQIPNVRIYPLALLTMSPPSLCCSHSRSSQYRVFTRNNPGSCNVPTKAFPAWILKYVNVSMALDVSPRLRASVESSRCRCSPCTAVQRVALFEFVYALRCANRIHVVEEKIRHLQSRVILLDSMVNFEESKYNHNCFDNHERSSHLLLQTLTKIFHRF